MILTYCKQKIFTQNFSSIFVEMKSKKIILIGFMGSGKTTFGKKLASKMNLPFIDSDMEISMNENKSINEIFEAYGENHFRDLESAFIKNLKDTNEGFILSTGGGLPCFGDNMEVLNQLGTTIYLEMNPKALLKRLENGLDERPLLKDLSENELLDTSQTCLLFKLDGPTDQSNTHSSSTQR